MTPRTVACAALAAFGAVTLASPACDHRSRAEREATAMTGGDPRRGAELVAAYGCGTCHAVPGVPGATGTVGPRLQGVASRSFLAGRLENTPANLVRWIRSPREVDPETAMPDTGVTEHDARDVAAYLETLR